MSINLTKSDRAFPALVMAWTFSLIFSIVIAEALAAVLGLIWLWLRRRQPQAASTLHFPVLIFCGLRLLTIATALSPATSLHALRKIPFMLVFLPISYWASRSGAPEVIRWLRILVLAGIAASAFGLVKIGVIGLHRLHSTTAGPTTLAMFLAVSFVAGLTLFIHGLSVHKKFLLAGLASMLLAMAFTYCRTPWLAAGLVGLGLLWLHARRHALILLAAIAAILAVVPGFRMRYQEAVQWPYALGDRPVIWQKGWELVPARPLLGYGPGSFHLIFDQQYRLRDRQVGAWHNFVLQLWIESGLAGVLALGWILWRASRIALTQMHLGSPAWPATEALVAGLLVLLLAGLAGGLIGDPIIDMLFWSMLGVLSGLEEKNLVF